MIRYKKLTLIKLSFPLSSSIFIQDLPLLAFPDSSFGLLFKGFSNYILYFLYLFLVFIENESKYTDISMVFFIHLDYVSFILENVLFLHNSFIFVHNHFLHYFLFEDFLFLVENKQLILFFN